MFFCMLTLLFLVRHGEIYAAEECTAPKHILFISSYSYSWGSVPWQIKGVARALQGTDYAVNYEFMDTKNTQYSDGYKEYYTLLKYKLASRCHYDGVIVADDAALNFAVLYKQELFAGAPIVFLAVDNIANAEKAAAAPDVTGIVEQADYARNIDAAGTLLPHADNVTFIFDNRENGIGIAAQLERQKAAFENYHVQYINTSSLTREELIQKLSSFTENDIVFCISMGQLKDNVILTENERYQMIREYASVPMFRLSTAGVGDGMLGGYVVDFDTSGYLAADMLKDMLNHPGDKTPAMRYDTPGMYYFDYAVLKKFGLKMSALPEEAEVINLPVSLWRKYSNQIIIGLLLVLLTASLAFSFVISETQRKLRINNEELRKANRAKMDFLSNMSHDMRTPMNAILGLTALLRGRTDPAEIRSDVGQIEKSGRYLLSLINDTLDMSKIEAGKLELHPAPAGRREIAENILMTARILADQKGVHFTAELPPDKSEAWSPVYVDVSRTEQVFINLLSNAVKFTPAGGTVTLRMENMSVSSTEIVDRITVSDTGIGMSQEFQKHLFEPFSQEGRANTSRESGTGLGLAIVKRMQNLYRLLQ